MTIQEQLHRGARAEDQVQTLLATERSLRMQIAVAEDAMRRMIEVGAKADAEIEKLRSDRAQYDSWAREIKINIDAMRGENDELRAALEKAKLFLKDELIRHAITSGGRTLGQVIDAALEQKAGEK